MHPDCWKKCDFLQRELDSVRESVRQAELHEDEECCLRYKQQALMHMTQMHAALAYFMGDFEETVRNTFMTWEV